MSDSVISGNKITQNGSITSSLAGAGATSAYGIPAAQGLYSPKNEHDACGVGFIAQLKNVKSHKIIEDGLFMLENLTHRGAVGADPLVGDGAGIFGPDTGPFFS